MSRSKGFTFVGFVVVIAIVLALAGVITPLVSRDLADSKLESARVEVNRIANAMVRYANDTHYPPTGIEGRKSYHLLVSAGVPPLSNRFASGAAKPLATFLVSNEHRAASWNGPYLERAAADPWGTQYLVNVEGYFNDDERIWVICAGPNRTIDTAPEAFEAGGDDIAVCLR